MPLLVEDQPQGERARRRPWQRSLVVLLLLACLGAGVLVPLSPVPIRMGEYWLTGPNLERSHAIYGRSSGPPSFLWTYDHPGDPGRRPQFWGQSVKTWGPFTVWHMEPIGRYEPPGRRTN